MLPTTDRRATAPFDRPAPEAKPAERPELRVIDRKAANERAVSRRRRRAALCAAVFIAAAVFGVVVAHVAIAQGQFELAQLQERAAKQQADYDRLRLQVAELESPDRIVAEAQQRLGMVAPAHVTYLAPSPQDGPAATPAATPNTDGGSSAPPSSWPTLKPHLAEG